MKLVVSGQYACFSRPGIVDRVTYDLITPTAAAGVLRSIFGKPEFEWRVDSIGVLRRGHKLSVMRNEIRLSGATGGRIDVEDGNIRDQRHTLILADVAYLIEAHMVFPNYQKGHEQKYAAQLERRLQRGECFQTPYLGCREFIADWRAADGSEQPINWSQDLGRLPLAIDFRYPQKCRPRFFSARVEKGVLHVPLSDEVRL